MGRGPTLDAYRRMVAVLDTPLVSVKGVGPKVFERLTRKGLRTLGDALAFLPLRYEDRVLGAVRGYRSNPQSKKDLKVILTGCMTTASRGLVTTLIRAAWR